MNGDDNYDDHNNNNNCLNASQYFLFNDDLPPPTSRQRKVTFACGAFILLSFAVALALSFSLPCSVAAISYGAAQGILSSIAFIIMQMPQILVTWRTRASASLSLITVFLNAAGGFLVAYVQVFASQERWSTYLPNLVRSQKIIISLHKNSWLLTAKQISTVQNTILFVMAAAFDLKLRALKKKIAVEGGDTMDQPLLLGQR
jgi:hypothetical protein